MSSSRFFQSRNGLLSSGKFLHISGGGQAERHTLRIVERMGRALEA